MLTKVAVIKFQEIYFQVYGVTLSDSEAYEQAIKLVNLYRAVYLPIEITKGKKVYEKAI